MSQTANPAPMNAMDLMKQKQQASKMSPILKPGTYQLWLREIEIKEAPFGNSGENKTIALTWETDPVESPDFKGLLKNPQVESLGRFSGQIASTMIDRFWFSDFKTRGGKVVTQEEFLFRALREFYVFFWGNEEAVPYNPENYNGFRDYFDDVRDFLLDNPVKALVTIGGEAYMNKKEDKEYLQYRLFLPRIDKDKGEVAASAFFEEDKTVMPVLEFDEDKHIIKVKSEEDKKANDTTSSFGKPAAPAAPAAPGAPTAPAAPRPAAPVAPGAPGSTIQR